ncbi:MAG: PDGLE domain-containing protein [Candidatus Thorarchaeota archaeon]
MNRDTLFKVVLPTIIILVAITTVLILSGLASENPDGFEWALFEWAGISEPESGYEGLFAFLGEGPLVDAITGGIGIVLILVIAYIFFRYTSRKEE